MEFIKPEEVAKSFELRPGMVVADFGCGSGHYVVEAGKLVGETGKVYAIDIQKNLLEATKSRAEKAGLENVEIIWGDLEVKGGSKLGNGSIDFVILSNTLFQAENKQAVVEEVFRVLKDGGRVAIIDWHKKDGGAIGPRMDQRISQEETETLMEQASFKKVKEFTPAESHYGLIFSKNLPNP